MYPSSEGQHSIPEPDSGSDAPARPSSGGYSWSGLTGFAGRTRNRLKSHPVTRPVYVVTVSVVGLLVVALGLVLVPFPGPGWLIVIVGLLILASEFVWAQRLVAWVRRQVDGWTDWIKKQSVLTRIGVALATGLIVGSVLYVTALLGGLPGWVPGWLVPPLPGLEQYTSWG